MKRFRKWGVFAYKVRKQKMRNKKRYKRPVWNGVSLHTSKNGGGMKEEYHCQHYVRCRTTICRVVIPLNNKPPKRCIKEKEVKNAKT